ncbi:MAG: pyrrolo-quinoline quinone, partial [Pacificimonas sp.]
QAQVVAVSRGEGRVRWVSQLPRWRDAKDKKGPIFYRGPIAAGGQLWLTSSRGLLISVSPTDGSVTSSREIADTFYLPPIVAGGTMYLLDESGRLSAWR